LVTKTYVDTQVATKQNTLSNASYLDVTSSAQTQINNLNTVLTGASWDSTYYYLNLSNNLHVYGSLQLAGLSNDVNSTFTDVYSQISTINSTLSGTTTLGTVLSSNNTWTGTNVFNTSLPTSTVSPSSASQLVTKTYVDTQVATKQNTLSNASYLDVTSSAQTQINTINTALSGKQNTLSNASYLDVTSSAQTQINTINTTLSGKQNTLSNASYLDVTSSAQTQINTINTALSAKQPTITSSINLTTGTISCTSLTCTSETDSGALNCNSLNVNKAAITSDGSSFWLNNNTNGYGSNFALYQGSGGNTVLNSSSGQDMEFKINNTMYMQMYPNGVVQVGSNQAFNKQLVLYDGSSSDTPSTATTFYGFGINSHVLRYQVDTTSSGHKFYGGTTNYASIDNTGITVNNGVLTSNNVTAPASNNLTLNAPSGQTINFAFANTNYCSISQSYLTIPSIVCNTNLNCNGTFNLIPAGTIYMSVISSMSGYLLCDGTSYSTTTYATLYNAISYNFGGSGSSFKVPDFRGAFLRGYGTNGSYTNYVGTSLGSAQTDTLGSHNHTISPPNANYQYGNNSGNYGDATGTHSVETSGNYGACPTSTNSTGSSETRPFNYSVNYFIKF
jgi:hypothetical protein